MTCSPFSPIGSIQAQDFTCAKGDDFYEPIQLVDKTTGAIEDISVWTFTFKVWASWAAKLASPGTTLISLALGSGIQIIDGPNGKLSIAITAAQTGTIPITGDTLNDEGVPENVCVYDFIAVDENALTRTTLRGSFTFTL